MKRAELSKLVVAPRLGLTHRDLPRDFHSRRTAESLQRHLKTFFGIPTLIRRNPPGSRYKFYLDHWGAVYPRAVQE